MSELVPYELSGMDGEAHDELAVQIGSGEDLYAIRLWLTGFPE